MTKQDHSAPSKRQGKFAGMPFDWRRPTVERAKSRLWNQKDARLFTPKALGWGYDINFYWLAHPGGYLAARRAS
ncbi:MAG TPA: DUF5808 domain-containing protein [Solirubrobacteraceae bacterium]